MRTRGWLLAPLALALCASARRTPLRGSSSRGASLALLLRHLAREYLHDCALSLVYDSSYERGQPVDVRECFGALPLAFAHESLGVGGGGERARRRRLDGCTNYVLFLADLGAVRRVLARDVASKIVVVSAATPWQVKDFLKSDVAGGYANLVVVCRSAGRERGHGAYLLYTNQLYADGSGVSRPLLLASWLNGSLSRPDVHLFRDKLHKGFMGHRLLVSAAENPPFTIRRSRSSQDEAQWDGLEVRLLQLAGSYLNLSVEFTEPRSQLLSPLDAAKADVAQGLTSMAIGGIYRTIDLADAFDATTPHYQDCAAFISLASTALPKYRAVLGPFQPSVWIMLIVSYFALIVPLSFNSKYSLPSLLRHPSGLNSMFWFVFSTYTNGFTVKSPLLGHGIAKNSSSLLMGVYWVFSVIVAACYSGSIVAFVTLPVFPAAVERAEDLAHQRYRIGTLDRDGWPERLDAAAADEPPLSKLSRGAERVPSLLEGVRNASRAHFWPYAFLASRAALDYLVQTEFAPSRSAERSLMHVSEQCFVRYQVVQLLPPESLYTARMSDLVARAGEHGLLARIAAEVDWEVQRAASAAGRKVTEGPSRAVALEERVLSVEDTQGMFLVLGSGVLVALLALGCEGLHSRLRRGRALVADGGRASAGCDRRGAPSPQSWMVDHRHDRAHPELRLRHSRSSV